MYYVVLWVGMCCIWCIPSWIWTIHYTSKNWKMYKRQFLAAAVALAVWALFSFLFNSMITQRGTFLTEGDLLMGENYLWLKSLKYILILFCQVLKPNLIPILISKCILIDLLQELNSSFFKVISIFYRKDSSFLNDKLPREVNRKYIEFSPHSTFFSIECELLLLLYLIFAAFHCGPLFWTKKMLLNAKFKTL